MFWRLPIGVATLQEVGILSTWVYFLPLGGLRGSLGLRTGIFEFKLNVSLPRRTEIRQGEGMNLLQEDWLLE